MKNIILLFFLIPTLLVGQDIDTERMNRDIKVAENGLKSLIQDESSSTFFTSEQNGYFRFNSRSIEGQYIQNYGVIFTADICEPCAKNKFKKKKGAEESKIQFTDHLTDAAKTFLADYGSIIGQLKDDQKIMIRFTDEGGNNFPARLKVIKSDGKNTTVWAESNTTQLNEIATRSEISPISNSQEITVEVLVSDLKANMAGKISRDALVSRIKTESKTMTFEDDPQLETFTAMFHRLYQKDLSSTYFMSRKPSYGKLSNVGIMIKARVYSSNVLDNERYTIPTIGEKNISLEERNTIVSDMLPEFEKVFKENIISYARTIRSLEKGQSIIFEVRMTECKGCYDFPRYMNFSISQDVLDNFNKGKLSFDQAVAKITVEQRSA